MDTTTRSIQTRPNPPDAGTKHLVCVCHFHPRSFSLLTKAVMRDKPALVIIDPIIRMARMVDSNSYSEASGALEPFIAMARESGAHVMLVHHSGRGDRRGVDAPMGSTAFAGSVDSILVMCRSERMRTLSSVQRYGTAQIKLLPEKARVRRVIRTFMRCRVTLMKEHKSRTHNLLVFWFPVYVRN